MNICLWLGHSWEDKGPWGPEISGMINEFRCERCKEYTRDMYEPPRYPWLARYSCDEKPDDELYEDIADL